MIDPDSWNFQLSMVLTIVIIIIKLGLGCFFLVQVMRKRDQENRVGWYFFLGVCLFLLLMGLSRIFYFIFDYNLTQFDTTRYLNPPSNLWYWRLGSIFSIASMGTFLFFLDRHVLGNKFRTIPTILLFSVAVIHAVFPVSNVETDFFILSLIGTIAGFLVLLVPIVFFWLGYRNPTIRTTAYLIALSTIIYAAGGFLIGESVVGPLRTSYGEDVLTVLLLANMILKTVQFL